MDADRDPDRVVDRIARAQHGAFSRAQASAAGFSPRMIRRRLAAGAWLQLDRSVFALPGHPFNWERQAMAATLAVEGAALSGRSAAALHGIDGFRKGGLEIVVPRERRRSSTVLATVRSTMSVRSVTIDSIPCLAAVDLPLDLADRLTTDGLERLVEALLIGHLTTIDELLDRFVRFAAGRRPGANTLRAILENRSARAYVPPSSELERWLYIVLDDTSLPEFDRQAELPWWPMGEGRVDAYSRSCTLIVEGDGRAWHTRERDFVKDRRRDNLAAANGHQVVRFTYGELRNDGDGCRDVVRRTALARGWRPN
jgi:very-short-patch-repair endonuclease